MASNTDWIDQDLIRRLLIAEHAVDEGTIEILNIIVGAATKKGDNYASDMYRAVVEYKCNGIQQKCTRILKVMPSGAIQKVIMEKNSIFPREIAVYNNVLPRITEMMRRIGDNSFISPACTYITEDPKLMLVFQDIKEQGYQMVDRKLGLNLEQARLVIIKLAKLHACSAILYQKDREVMVPFMEGAISTNPNRQDFLKFYTMCARQVVKLVESWNESQFTDILERLRNLPKTIISKGCNVYTRDDSVFNVLNHDDVWTSNMMFKYKNGIATDVLLFDYQLAYFGSPGVDLNYFLDGSVQEDVRDKHWLLLIREYFTILKETLEKLNYSGTIPSLQDIHVEIIRTGFHSVNAVLCLLPLAMMEHSENAEMDVFLQENETGESFRREVFSNPRYKSILENALKRFDMYGYFD